MTIPTHTEQDSLHNNLETWTVESLLTAINHEDYQVAPAITKALPQIITLTSAIVERMKQGGRMFYLGAGTSGRLGILDASECPPTFGVPMDWVMGLIAGGDSAIRRAVEGAEDDENQAWSDLLQFHPQPLDTLIGIAASGRTPYVIGGLQMAKKAGLLTGCITCNPGSPVSLNADFPIEVITGPEFVTGSTRMKAGTAQKMILNMISTTVMIQMGRIKGNKMVDMQLTNQKLVDRGSRILMELLNFEYEEAKQLLMKYGSVRKVLKLNSEK